MNQRQSSTMRIAAVLAFGWMPLVALAHHSLSGQFDTTKSFELTGVVSRVDWVNPHTYVYVDVKQADGSPLTYKLESLPVAMMRKAGLSKQDLLGDGKAVLFKAHPARNGTATLGYLVTIKLGSGREVQFAKVPGAEDPAAGGAR
jgi:Family of unknown function (DUF6152)